MRRRRGGIRFGVRYCGVAMLAWFLFLPLVLEWLGAFLGIANILIAVLPALFVARLRGTLSVMQERELVRSWHLRRLGDDLMQAAA